MLAAEFALPATLCEAVLLGGRNNCPARILCLCSAHSRSFAAAFGSGVLAWAAAEAIHSRTWSLREKEARVTKMCVRALARVGARGDQLSAHHRRGRKRCALRDLCEKVTGSRNRTLMCVREPSVMTAAPDREVDSVHACPGEMQGAGRGDTIVHTSAQTMCFSKDTSGHRDPPTHAHSPSSVATYARDNQSTYVWCAAPVPSSAPDKGATLHHGSSDNSPIDSPFDSTEFFALSTIAAMDASGCIAQRRARWASEGADPGRGKRAPTAVRVA